MRHRSTESRTTKTRQGDPVGQQPIWRQVTTSIPHAQRIHGGAQEAEREADRPRHPALQHRHPRRPLAAVASRARRPAILLAIANHLIRTRPLRPPTYVRALVELAASTCRRCTRRSSPPPSRASRRSLGDAVRASTRSTSPREESGASRRRRCAEVAEVVAGPPARRLSTHTWRSATAGNEGGWQVASDALPAERAHRLGSEARAELYPERVEQVRAATDPPAAPGTGGSGTSSTGRSSIR